jgi:hypothetical protein
MNTKLNFRIVLATIWVGLTVSYLLCIAGDLLFTWQMYLVWAPLLPGFTWPLTTGGFLLGLLWLVGYSLYTAALITLPYNFLSRRTVSQRIHQ